MQCVGRSSPDKERNVGKLLLGKTARGNSSSRVLVTPVKYGVIKKLDLVEPRNRERNGRLLGLVKAEKRV